MTDIDNIVISTRLTSNNAKGKRKLTINQRNIQDLNNDDNNNTSSNNKKNKIAIETNLHGLDSAIPILKSTELSFYGKKTGNKGLRKSLKQSINKDIDRNIDSKQYELFYRSLPTIDCNYNHYNNLLISNFSQYNDWLFHLQTSNNILLYGIGNKRELLINLSNVLSNDDVIQLDGDICNDTTYQSIISLSEKSIRKLLELICNDIIDKPDIIKRYINIESSLNEITDSLNKHYGWIDSPDTLISNKLLLNQSNKSSYEAHINIDINNNDIELLDRSTTRNRIQTNSINKNKPIDSTKVAQSIWGGRYIYAKSKLYLLIHSFDSEIFTTTLAQTCLSHLARCPSIGLVVTTNHMNVSHILTPEQLSYYKFKYIHIPTYLPYPLTSNCQLIPKNTLKKINGSIDRINISIDSILLSASSKLKSIIGIISKETINKRTDIMNKQIDSNTTINPIDTSILESDLVEICKKKLIIKAYTDINPYIKELVDQHVIDILNDKKRNRYIHMLLTTEVLQQLATIN